MSAEKAFSWHHIHSGPFWDNAIRSTMGWALLAYGIIGLWTAIFSEIPTIMSATPTVLSLMGALCVAGAILLSALHREGRNTWLLGGALVGWPLAVLWALGQHMPALWAQSAEDARNDATYQTSISAVLQSGGENSDPQHPSEKQCKSMLRISSAYIPMIPHDVTGLILRRNAVIRLWTLGCLSDIAMFNEVQQLVGRGKLMPTPMGWVPSFRSSQTQLLAQLPLTGYEWCIQNPAWQYRNDKEQKQLLCMNTPDAPNIIMGPKALPAPGNTEKSEDKSQTQKSNP